MIGVTKFLNKRNIGSGYEVLAISHIRDNGGIILETNYRNKNGEIDIIARDGRYLCFIEVKYRSSDRFGGPEAAVNIAKQRKICKVSEYYLYCKRYGEDTPVRYDVLSMSGQDNAVTVKWIKNAFEYVG